MLETIELADDLEMSRVLTGLWQVADVERVSGAIDPEEGAEELQRYVQAGLTTFDMADHYGTSEVIAGRHQARWPGTGTFFTKWVPKPGAKTRRDVRAAVERALGRMQRERIDLLQFHAWSYADPAWLDCVFWLDELRAEGLIGHLGLTNTDTAHLGMLLDSGVPIVSNQVCYSLIDRRAAGAMAELCADRGVKLLAFGTVAGGFLTERWLDAPEPAVDELPTWSLMKYKRFIDAAGGWTAFQGLLRGLNRAAQRVGAPMANVACRYMLDSPAVGGIIVGARLGKSDHIDDTLALTEVSLDDGARADIEAGLAGMTPVPGDCGDEYRKPPFLTAAGDLSDHFESFPSPYPTLEGPDGRTRAVSGTVWEDLAGFSRAVRTGNRILVSGTTATHGDRLIGGSDPASQTHFCIDKLEGAIRSLGGRLEDVVRTRIFIDDPAIWEPVSRAHGARFAEIRPANTLVHAGLIGDGYLVEMEAEAIVD